MKKTLLVLGLIIIAVIGCSKDEESPVESTPKYIGEYAGKSAEGKDVSFSVKNINGKAFVTSYSITYSFLFGSTTGTATLSRTDSEGLTEVKDNSFLISMSNDEKEKITGVFTNEITLSGSYSIETGVSSTNKQYATGTFTVNKK